MSRLIAQRRENILRLLTRYLEIERIGAQINPVVPDQFTGEGVSRYPYLSEEP